jgi:hypothetical protein
LLLSLAPLERCRRFDYIEEHKVPYDEKRYHKIVSDEPLLNGNLHVLAYQKEKPDYMPACLKCMDPDEGEFVECPKIGAQINNISDRVKWEAPKAPYCNLRKEEATNGS